MTARANRTVCLLKINGENLAIPVVRRKGRRRVSIIVFPDSRVEVRAPLRMADRAIEAFILQASDWLSDRLKRNARQASTPSLKYVDGEKLPYLGEDWTLYLAASRSRMRIDSAKKVIVVGPGKRSNRDRVEAWFRKQAEILFEERIRFYAQIVGRAPRRFRVKNMRTRWGSCSSNGSLSLNWKILAGPIGVIDYLIVHELCHLLEPNHSRRFWAEVERVLPSFATHRLWLKRHGSELLSRFDS